MTEPCPHCVGLCCRDYEANCRTTHRAAQFWEHMCHYCTEGKSLKPARTALDERKDVLAWLRDVSTSPTMSADEMVTLHWVARAIFGMEHVGAAAKEKP